MPQIFLNPVTVNYAIIDNWYAALQQPEAFLYTLATTMKQVLKARYLYSPKKSTIWSPLWWRFRLEEFFSPSPLSFEEQVLVLAFHHRKVSLFINGNTKYSILFFCNFLLKSSAPNLLKFLLLKIAMRKLTSQGQKSLQGPLRIWKLDF